MALDNRRAAFVREYVRCLNAAEAARRAGYSDKTAKQQGARLLTNADVRAAIEAQQQALQSRHAITLDRWLEELALIGFSDVTHYDVDPMGGIAVKAGASTDVTRVISAMKTRTHYGPEGSSTVETEFKLHDKLSALEKIGRHMGFYPKEFGGEGSPNGRQGLSVDKTGSKTRITWGDLVLEV